MTLMGAARESTKEAMSVQALRHTSLTSCRGDMGPSVMEITCAPQERAKRMAFTVRVE